MHKAYAAFAEAHPAEALALKSPLPFGASKSITRAALAMTNPLLSSVTEKSKVHFLIDLLVHRSARTAQRLSGCIFRPRR